MKKPYKKRRPRYELATDFSSETVKSIDNYIEQTVSNNLNNGNKEFTFGDYFGDNVKLWEFPLKEIFDYYLKKYNSHNKAMTESAKDAGLALKNFLIDKYQDELIIKKITRHGKIVNSYIINR